MNRRHFLGGAAAAAGLVGLPRRARASAGDRKFVFVFNQGGWDPTRVFAPEYANANVAMEANGAAATAGGISYVDHPNRPSVRSFLDAYHGRALVLNGMLVRAISHDLCTVLAMTGKTTGSSPDWPSLLAASRADKYVLPHLVIGGPSYSGTYGALVSRTGAAGQLEGLLSGSLSTDASDISVPRTDGLSISAIDLALADNIAARLARAGAGVDGTLASDFQLATEKALALRRAHDEMSFATDDTFSSQAAVAADALSLGFSRCVSLAYPSDPFAVAWDSHGENDSIQSPLWEGLFAGLNELMAALEAAPGDSGGSLADETIVVVLSEMGRTPALNGQDGKDHWPYTSAMLVGRGFTGDRVVGAYDAYYNGSPVDPLTGELSEGGEVPSSEMLGSTILALGDVDPEPYALGASVLEGVLE